MTLLEIRRKFITLSGRYDLATTTTTQFDTDNGADFFINAAVHTLDLSQEVGQNDEYVESNLVAGNYSVTVQGPRYIKSVWLVDADGNEEELEFHSFAALRREYPALGATDQGTSKYWSIQPSAKQSTGAYTDQATVLVMPPTDEAVAARVYGQFYSRPLAANTDKNRWSVAHDDVLVKAALRELEGFYRNMQGYNDFSTVLAPSLNGIDKDLAAIDTAAELEMEG